MTISEVAVLVKGVSSVDVLKTVDAGMLVTAAI
jgi:hypothetical protein